MFTVKSRVYAKAADGRTILLYTPGTVITDDDAKRAGLVKGTPSASKPAKGLVIKSEGTAKDDTEPKAKPIDRNTNLSDLRAICAAEDIDSGDANTRAEFRDVIEAAREAAASDEDQAV